MTQRPESRVQTDNIIDSHKNIIGEDDKLTTRVLNNEHFSYIYDVHPYSIILSNRVNIFRLV